MAAQARHVDMWVTEGIISRDQAESICEFERQVAPSRVTASEVLAYTGAAVAAGGAAAMVAGVWHQLSHMERLSAVGFTAASLLATGLMADGDGSPATNRFGETALALSVPTVGLTIGLAVGLVVGTPASLLIGSIAAGMVAAALYAGRHSSPRQVALLLTALNVLLSLAMYSFENVSITLTDILIVIVGAGWVTATGAGWITPRLTGEIAGSVSSLVGSMVLLLGLDTGFVAPLGVAVTVAVCTVIVGVVRSRIALTIVGIVALASYVPWLASEILGPSIGTPFILVTAAMTLALWATRKTTKK